MSGGSTTMQGLLGSDSGGSSQIGWFADIKKKWKEGKFKTYARWLGVVNVFLMVGLTAFTFATFISDIITNCIAIAFGVIIGILELPFCCTCFQICQKIQVYLSVFEVYWLRAVLYIGIGVLLEVLASQLGGMLSYLYGVLNILAGLCYLLAYVRGETFSAEDKTAGGMGINTTTLKAKVAATAMGIV